MSVYHPNRGHQLFLFLADPGRLSLYAAGPSWHAQRNVRHGPGPGRCGGLIAGLFSNHIRAEHLHRYLLVVGASFLPAALCFFIGVPAEPAGVVIVGCTMVSQALACIFSIVAMSVVLKQTPDHLLGKITAHITTLSMCALPMGQALYGLLFDVSGDWLYLILLGASLATCLVGISSRGSLLRLAGAEPAPPSIPAHRTLKREKHR